MNFAEVGKKIAEIRKEKGWKQADLARECGVSRTLLSELERGTASDVGMRKVMRILAQLGVCLEVVPRRRPTLDEVLRQHEEMGL